MTNGFFITLEGGEGVGKSTNLAFIENWLNEQGFQFVITREPGGTPLAEEIREMILQHREETVTPLTELMLFFSGRVQHVETLIKPALVSGKIVLSDRFTDATYAYQNAGRGVDDETVIKLEQISLDGFQPDLTIYLDADPRIGLSRAKQRGSLDRIETENIEFFDNVRKGYLKRAAQFPERFVVINAEQELSRVQSDIQKVLEQRVPGYA